MAVSMSCARLNAANRHSSSRSTCHSLYSSRRQSDGGRLLCLGCGKQFPKLQYTLSRRLEVTVTSSRRDNSYSCSTPTRKFCNMFLPKISHPALIREPSPLPSHSRPCRRPPRCCCCSRHYSLDFLRIRHCQGHVFVIAAITVFLSYLPSTGTCLRSRLAPLWIHNRQRRSPLKAHTMMPSIKDLWKSLPVDQSVNINSERGPALLALWLSGKKSSLGAD